MGRTTDYFRGFLLRICAKPHATAVVVDELDAGGKMLQTC
jgi:hypothetical protein